MWSDQCDEPPLLGSNHSLAALSRPIGNPKTPGCLRESRTPKNADRNSKRAYGKYGKYQADDIEHRSVDLWARLLVSLSSDAYLAVWLDLAHGTLGLSSDDRWYLRHARCVPDHGFARSTRTS